MNNLHNPFKIIYFMFRVFSVRNNKKHYSKKQLDIWKLNRAKNLEGWKKNRKAKRSGITFVINDLVKKLNYLILNQSINK